MKKITPELVVNAYKETGLKPTWGRLFHKEQDECYACGVGVLLAYTGNVTPEEATAYAEFGECTDLYERFYEIFRVDSEFPTGFDNGVNDWSPSSPGTPGYRLGWRCGSAVRKELGECT